MSLKVADNVSKQNIPVLYLDTELHNNFQCDRRIAQNYGIPLYAIKRCTYLNTPMQDRFKEAVNEFEKYPIYYVDVKGWSIERMISAIRKFYAQHVGKKMTIGGYEQGLVVYDYLKLMRSSDKGFNKEYEELGYRMTILHDLMGEYNNPMLVPAQQNRDGLERNDESTVSGSDRIVHLCDSLNFLFPMTDVDLMNRQAQGEQVPVQGDGGVVHMEDRVNYNMKFKVGVCREGPGTPGESYIPTYMDIKDQNIHRTEVCGKIQMGKLCRVEAVNVQNQNR